MGRIVQICWIMALLLLSVAAENDHNQNETYAIPFATDQGLQPTMPAADKADLEQDETLFGGFRSACHNIAGLALLIIGMVLAFVNERRHVRMQAIIAHVRSKVVEVSSPEETGFGDLVHVSGMLATPDTVLVDDELGGLCQAPAGAVKLKRSVEMYQWIQTSGNTYKAEWLDYAVDSKSFADQSRRNPTMPCGTVVYYHEGVHINEFRVPASLLGKLQGWCSMAVREEVSAMMELNDSYTQMRPHADGLDMWIYFRYMGDSEPGIGDVRIRYWYVPATAVSITAIFTGDEFGPMRFKDVVPMFKKRASTSLTDVALEVDEHLPLVKDHQRADNFEETQHAFSDLQRGVETISRLDPARFVLEWYIFCSCCGASLAFFEASVPTEVYLISEGTKGAKENLRSLEGERGGMGSMLHVLRILGFCLIWVGLHNLANLLENQLQDLPLVGSCLAASLRVTTIVYALSATITMLAAAWFSYKSRVGRILLLNALGFSILGFSIGHLA